MALKLTSESIIDEILKETGYESLVESDSTISTGYVDKEKLIHILKWIKKAKADERN